MQNQTKKIIYIILLIIETLLLIAGYTVPNWWCGEHSVVVDGDSGWVSTHNSTPPYVALPRADGELVVNGSNPVVVVVHRNDGHT